MKKKRSNRKKQLLSIGMMTALSIQALPIAQVGAVYEEAAAEEEQFRQELAAQSDAYPEGAFAFYEESATVTEGDEDIAVQVVRPGDTSTDASVDLKSVNATAKYGEDFDVYYLDGDEKVYHSVPDDSSKETTYYSDRVELSYSDSRYSSTTVKLKANTDSLCRDAKYRLNNYTVYYPRYTIKMEDANPTLQGKKYTAEGKSTNINVPALSSKSSSWNSSRTRRVTIYRSLVRKTEEHSHLTSKSA